MISHREWNLQRNPQPECANGCHRPMARRVGADGSHLQGQNSGEPLLAPIQLPHAESRLRGGMHEADFISREHASSSWPREDSHWDPGRDQRAGFCPKAAVGQPCCGWFNTCKFPELAIKGCVAPRCECLFFVAKLVSSNRVGGGCCFGCFCLWFFYR